MTRFKKELKKRGQRFDEDFGYLPIETRKGSNIVIETIYCNAENVTLTKVFNVLTLRFKYNRAMQVESGELL
jgi:uncharacterized protein YjfI (DUF2170 family)